MPSVIVQMIQTEGEIIGMQQVQAVRQEGRVKVSDFISINIDPNTFFITFVESYIPSTKRSHPRK